MAKYYLDQEFIEDFHKPFLGKRRHYIDLISIALVCEDGREYSAISSEYDYFKASGWVKDNVIRPLYEAEVAESLRFGHFAADQIVPIHEFQKVYGKPVKQIAAEIVEFVNPVKYQPIWGDKIPAEFAIHDIRDVTPEESRYITAPVYVAHPTFYGWYAAYDWVLLASMFGTMMDLPKGFPMYCRDLKQTWDEKVERIMQVTDFSFEKAEARIQKNPAYPVNGGEHLAIYDARFSRDLHTFLQKL